MARRKPRRQARRSVLVLGHKLSPEQKAEYDRELERRRRIKPGESWEDSEAFALGNVLYRARPSVQAQKVFESMQLWKRLQDAATALSGFDHLPLTHKSPEIRASCNELIGRIAEEIDTVGRGLRTIYAAIAKENLEARR